MTRPVSYRQSRCTHKLALYARNLGWTLAFIHPHGLFLPRELHTRQDFPRRLMAPLQVPEAIRGTRVRTAIRRPEGMVIPVRRRVEHQPGLRIGVPIDPQGERFSAILRCPAPTRNASEIAIEEIDRIIRPEGQVRIPEAEFPGAWTPLPSNGGKGIRRDHRGGEPLLFAGEAIRPGHIPACGRHLVEVAPQGPQTAALMRLDIILELHACWPYQPREVATIAETLAL